MGRDPGAVDKGETAKKGKQPAATAPPLAAAALPRSEEQKTTQPQVLSGQDAVPGIGIGIAWKIAPSPEISGCESVPGEKRQAEVLRFKRAVPAVRAFLTAAAADADEGLRDILETQMLFVGDPKAGQEVHILLQKGVASDEVKGAKGGEEIFLTAEAAVWRVYHKYIEKMAADANEYLRQRADDMRAARDLLIRQLRGEDLSLEAAQIPSAPYILVAPRVDPILLGQLKSDANLRGIVTQAGGRTDHTTIIAKALGIPRIFGVQTEKIPAGVEVLLNGQDATLTVNPTQIEIRRAREQLEIASRLRSKLPLRHRGPMTKDQVLVDLWGTVDLPEQAAALKSVGVKAVGLLRTEFMYFSGRQPLNEDEQFKSLKGVVEAFRGQPVVIRTLDIGGDKNTTALAKAHQKNPALGLKGLRFSLTEENLEYLKTQLRAILRVSQFGEVIISFPMVNDAAELKLMLSVVEEQRAVLAERGVRNIKKCPIYPMMETPAAALLAYQIFRVSDGILVGMNDLTQYELAADRENILVQHLAKAYHPAMIEALRILMKARRVLAENTKSATKPCFMCGEAASDPLYLPLALGLGFRSFNVDAASVEEMNHRLSCVTVADCEDLIAALRHPEAEVWGASDVYERLLDFHKRHR